MMKKSITFFKRSKLKDDKNLKDNKNLFILIHKTLPKNINQPKTYGSPEVLNQYCSGKIFRFFQDSLGERVIAALSG